MLNILVSLAARASKIARSPVPKPGSTARAMERKSKAMGSIKPAIFSPSKEPTSMKMSKKYFKRWLAVF